MSTGVISVGRRKYAVGLYWENSPSGHVAQAAKEAAAQSTTPVEFFVTRPGNEQGRVPQFGLGASYSGFRSGMPSLAGCLALQQPGSWIGAFSCDEGYAVIIVRDDLIVPDGDLFFETEDEARDRFLAEVAIGGFQRIFAPELWALPDTDSLPLTLVLDDNASVRLRAVALSGRAKLGLFVGSLLLIVAVGVGFYTQAENERKEVELRSRMAAIESARRAAQNMVPGMNKPVYPPPERRWEKIPKPMDVVDACLKAMDDVPAVLSGWRLSGVRCDDNALSVSWSRSSGFASTPLGASVVDNADVATRVITWEKLPPRGEEFLLDQTEVTQRYLTQNWPGTIKSAPNDPPPPPPANFHGEWDPPAPPWVKRSFTLNVPVLPWIIPTMLGNFPGVVIKSMTRSSVETGWTIEGEIYENRR
ncbi:MAG: type 4b pilus protein PilO2 [Bdellovibrionales bacterium]